MSGGAGDLPPELVSSLGRLGVPTSAITDAEPLTGGVSSDIWHISTVAGDYCVKRALPVLKTAQRWEVPTERSASEARWLEAVGHALPSAVPRLLGFDELSGTLLLEMLDRDSFVTWKSALLDGHVDPDVARSVGSMLRQIHGVLATPHQRQRFDNQSLFVGLRLEPYIERTAARHVDLEPHLSSLVGSFEGASSTVIHGDVSPKNILVADGRVVLVDAECATWGDPAFDLAFCLTHLCAKGVHLERHRATLHASASALIDGYSLHEDDELSARVARWLPALLLARVDGASPLEYLSEADQALVRAQAADGVRAPAPDATSALAGWFDDR